MSNTIYNLSASANKPSSKPTPPKKDRKRLYQIGGGILAVGILGAVAYGIAGRMQPAPDASQERVLAFIASDKFAELSPEQQTPYMDRMQEMGRDVWRNLDGDKRDQLMGNLMEARESKQVMEYAALPQEERTAYLDRLIDRFAQGPSPNRGPRPGGGEGRGGNGGSATAPQAGNQGGQRPRMARETRRKARYELRNPAVRGQREAFRQAMRERMQQRGVTPPAGRGR